MKTVTFDELTVPAPPRSDADWNEDGVIVMRRALYGLIPWFLSDATIDAYKAEWQAFTPDRRGWPDATPYMRYEALRALCCDRFLGLVLEKAIGEPAGVHLNLTGWVSTERDWHQDSYLNPPEVGDRYAAVWFALDDIDARSGPFQYVPGSHRWPQVTRERIGRHVDLDDPQWPKHSETVLSPLFEQEIAARGAEVVSYVPRRGDVLIWHGRLLHRGSRARVPGMIRPALIAHFSGISRSDFPPAVRHERGGHYFPIVGEQPVR